MKKMKSATRVADAEGRQYHIDCAPGDLAPYVLFLGDPDRTAKVAERFDRVETERRHREFRTVTGTWHGLRVSAMGTGIGPDNTEIAYIETCQVVKAPTVIRVGSCGALRAEIDVGDLVITQAAVRLENTSAYFVPETFPAFAHHEAVLALAAGARKVGAAFHLGITATAPGFYGAQGRAIPGFPLRFPDLPDRLAALGVANFEMEASALLTFAALRGFRAGAVCAVYANRPHDRFIDPKAKDRAEAAAIDTGLAALEILARMDRERGKDGAWVPRGL